jgi:hypothetical protein
MCEWAEIALRPLWELSYKQNPNFVVKEDDGYYYQQVKF